MSASTIWQIGRIQFLRRMVFWCLCKSVSRALDYAFLVRKSPRFGVFSLKFAIIQKILLMAHGGFNNIF